MQINLNPTEINDAIKAALVQKGIDLQNKAVSFKFQNRRTKGGIFATVVITNATTDAPAETATVVPTPAPEPVTAPVTVEQPSPNPTPEPVTEVQQSLFG